MNRLEFTQNILMPSLELIKNDSKIKKFYFFPGLLSVVFLSVTLVYQVIYTYVVLLGRREEALEMMLGLFHSEYIVELLITAWVFFIFYILLLPVFEWALIRYIDQKNSWEASRSDSIGFWIYRFAPLFEFNNIFSLFKFASILNGFLFSLRFLGVEYIASLSVIFFVAFLLSVILWVFIAYARFEIVLGNKGAFEAVWSSSKIALLNIKTTLKLYVLMFIMNLRVILNFVVFLVFPLLWIFIAGLITSQIFSIIAFTILGILFVFFVIALGYLSAVLDVFRTMIWYRAYLEWKKNLIEK